MKVIIFIFIFSFYFCEFACSLFPCEDSIKGTAGSPTGNYVASLSVIDCGATTDYSSLVRITSTGNSSSEEDIVFVAKGVPEIRLAWQGDSVLNISCDECQKDHIFIQKEYWRGVSINY